MFLLLIAFINIDNSGAMDTNLAKYLIG